MCSIVCYYENGNYKILKFYFIGVACITLCLKWKFFEIMRFRFIYLPVLLIAFLSSCGDSTKKITYFQDIDPQKTETISANKGITIQPKDILSIFVSSNDPELAALFNLPVVSYQNNSEFTAGQGSVSQQSLGYAVDEDGNINFPVLGKVHVAGLSRWQLQEKIKGELRSRDLLKDMIVTVQFVNFKISILGEVKNPGSYTIGGDKVNILEAISMAGDLTIYGVRDQVYVVREEAGERIVYNLDLRSTDIFSSPAYYLKQNDVIYVRPNVTKAGQSNLNENSLKSVGLWISIASMLTSVATLIVSITRD